MEIHIERNDLGTLFKNLGFKKGAEIGVEQGNFSLMLLKADLKLYLIDPWVSHNGEMLKTDKGVIKSEQRIIDQFYLNTQKKVAPYFGTEIIRKYSMEAILDFEDESLDFVYIDGDHQFESVVNDIISWSKKVRRGGIVAGHDYDLVKYAVDAYTEANYIMPWFVLKEPNPSWMWIK